MLGLPLSISTPTASRFKSFGNIQNCYFHLNPSSHLFAENISFIPHLEVTDTWCAPLIIMLLYKIFAYHNSQYLFLCLTRHRACDGSFSSTGNTLSVLQEKIRSGQRATHSGDQHWSDCLPAPFSPLDRKLRLEGSHADHGGYPNE